MTYRQIESAYGIPYNSLVSRYYRCYFEAEKRNGKNFFNEEQIIILTNKEHNPALRNPEKQLRVFQFKQDNPEFSNIEISEILGVNLFTVNVTLKRDYVLIHSKMNAK